MNRAAFMARVHELAEQLGGRLYRIVSKQGELVRAQALRHAKSQLRASMEGTDAAPDAAIAMEQGRTPVASERALRSPDRKALPDGARTPRARRGGGKPDHPDHAGALPGPPRAKGKRGPQRCRTCVEAGRPGLGHNAKTCGREATATASEEPDEVEVDEASTPSPPPNRSARFARIEAAAAARRTADEHAAAGLDS